MAKEVSLLLNKIYPTRKVSIKDASIRSFKDFESPCSPLFWTVLIYLKETLGEVLRLGWGIKKQDIVILLGLVWIFKPFSNLIDIYGENNDRDRRNRKGGAIDGSRVVNLWVFMLAFYHSACQQVPLVVCKQYCPGSCTVAVYANLKTFFERVGVDLNV